MATGVVSAELRLKREEGDDRLHSESGEGWKCAVWVVWIWMLMVTLQVRYWRFFIEIESRQVPGGLQVMLPDRCSNFKTRPRFFE